MKKIFLVLLISGLAGFGLYRMAGLGHKGKDGAGDSPVVAAVIETSSDKSSAPAAAPKAATAEAPKPALSAPTVVTPALVAKATTPRPPQNAAPALSAVTHAEPTRRVNQQQVTQLIAQGQANLKGGDKMKAWSDLSQAYWSGGEIHRAALLPTLQALSKEIFWNPRATLGCKIHVVQRGDSLTRIGKLHGVNYRGVARVNNIVRYHLIKVGQKIRIFPGPAAILISKSRFTLTLFVDGKFVKEYRVGLGRNNKTPVGNFELATLLIQPDWYPTGGGVIKYGDKRNLLGTRWLGFADKPGVTGFGIHGTWEPDTIGKRASDGCIRMNNADVEELYDFGSTGTRVEIEP